jgi:UDP-N-acetylmuramate dehydrogenase
MTFDVEAAYTELRSHFRKRLHRDEPLARHCTFGVGGPADLWVSLETSQELIELARLCAERHWPLLLIGNGTNVLYADAGVRGIVARNAINTYTIEDVYDGTALLQAGAGVSWPRLLNELAPLGWGGLEFGPGIPGTLGGGVITNAGAHNSDLGHVLEWIEVLDARSISENGKEFLADRLSEASRDSGVGDLNRKAPPGRTPPFVRRYMRNELNLSYRHSRFRAERRVQFNEQGYPVVPPRELIEPSEIILWLGIRLHREDPETLKASIEEYKQHRKRTQPVQKSAGSVFKNPPGDFAGRLIEQAGLKGLVSGKAQISERHANFIVNLGGASAADVVALIREARQRVYERFGVELELEVELRGDWGTA